MKYEKPGLNSLQASATVGIICPTPGSSATDECNSTGNYAVDSHCREFGNHADHIYQNGDFAGTFCAATGYLAML
ncbi:MAG: hypothetical protein NT099_00520 [Candidatus Saganbacteria bacterium]|nr:hypothetical protein [Candidatus Saganbacteria bacterium]